MPNADINALRSKLAEKDLQGILITAPANIRYLSGFTAGADARLLLTLEQQFIFTDSRYREQAALECPDWNYQEEKASALEKMTQVVQGFKKVGFESLHTSYAFYQRLAQSMPLAWEPVLDLVETQRLVKTPAELDKLKRAAQIGDETFTAVLPMIEAGVEEKSLADTIVYLLRQKGCEKEAFDAIVVSGENAALPHGRPGSRRFRPGDMVTMDFGGIFDGYVGDMTRTVAVKPATKRFREIYRAVMEAQQTGLDIIRAGVSCRQVDEAVRKCLQVRGLDQYFTHGTGHGVGLDIHEGPRLAASSLETLQENMVVTVEPGVYIPGWGGVRIEDTVIVTRSGVEIITHSSKHC
ncbi:MAG: M24 family metallopeptidase [Syntrophomonadaceae bacterium]|jgi:Xaa-Pro aminopeptidase